MIYYNHDAAIAFRMLEQKQATGDDEAVEILKRDIAGYLAAR
jgi:hypothetical protein